LAVSLDGREYRVPVKLAPELPDGVAGMPAGIREFKGLRLPATGTLARIT
jgi:hypothetical protein